MEHASKQTHPTSRDILPEHVFKLGCKNVYLSRLYQNPICDKKGMSNRASDKNK